MLKRLNVALVYNVKKDIGDDITGRGSMPDRLSMSDYSGDEDPNSKKTKADTYAEWDTEETILAVKTAIELNHEVTLIEANEEAYLKLLCARPDIVFNIAEGFRGPSREAQMPAMLEMLGIPYTGSDAITLGICLDKSRAKEILAYYRIPTPTFTVVDSIEQLSNFDDFLPCIVKPLHEGSSKGIFNSSVVYTNDQLRRQAGRVFFEYEEPAIVEKFLSGREFTVGLIGNGYDVQILPIVEIRFDSLPDGVNPIYSYEAKWIWDSLDNPLDVHECPANIPVKLKRDIETVCLDTYRILRCRDWCRIDIRLDDDGRPYVLEVNPLPGILPNPNEHSCFPQAARVAGMDYHSMVNTVLEAAIKRYGLLKEE